MNCKLLPKQQATYRLINAQEPSRSMEVLCLSIGLVLNLGLLHAMQSPYPLYYQSSLAQLQSTQDVLFLYELRLLFESKKFPETNFFPILFPMALTLIQTMETSKCLIIHKQEKNCQVSFHGSILQAHFTVEQMNK